jgi:hypothetical protein
MLEELLGHGERRGVELGYGYNVARERLRETVAMLGERAR